MRELRPAYADVGAFVEHVDGVLRAGGYRLIGAFGAVLDEPARAAAGFRVAESLAWGRHVYVDDLSTVPAARRQGLAGALLQWLVGEARAQGCGQLHLDSGTGHERFDAHRLYHAHGLSITSHHFAREV
jgi:GNAT superfamily N-acetyltransferase